MISIERRKLFLYFVAERQRIFRRREEGQQPPWTNDPILQTYRFCNIFREQDRTTKWIRDNWREPHRGDESVLTAMVLARSLNWVPTLEWIGYPTVWSKTAYRKRLEKRKAKGLKVLGTAYTITPGRLGEATTERILCTVSLAYKRRRLWLVENSVEETCRELKKINGIGPFIAYEICQDLLHTEFLQRAADRYTWASIGPGSRRGLNRLHGRSLTQSIHKSFVLNELCEVRDIILTIDSDPCFSTPLDLRTAEDALCEFDKYCRAIGKTFRNTYIRPGEDVSGQCFLDRFYPRVRSVSDFVSTRLLRGDSKDQIITQAESYGLPREKLHISFQRRRLRKNGAL